LVGVLTAAAVRVTPKAAEAVPAKVVADVPTRTAKLERVVGGLESILKAQGNGPEGPTKFAQILKPFLAGLNIVLSDVKANKNLTEAQKVEKLSAAEASVEGLTKDMAKRSQELVVEDETEKESLLLGVLMTRKGHPAAELEVMKSNDFKNLECVKHVLANRDENKDLVEQVAEFVDNKGQAPKKEAAAPALDKKSFEEAKQQIVTQLSGNLKKMEDHVSIQEKIHLEVIADQKNITDKLNAALKKAESGDSKLKGSAEKKAAAIKKVKRAQQIAKRMAKKEEIEYKREHESVVHDVASLKAAVESIKKGDMKALETAQKALQHSLASMQHSTGTFLHFLQFSAWDTSKAGACPYCKAQCLEKCHADGHSFMECMGTCDSVGN